MVSDNIFDTLDLDRNKVDIGEALGTANSQSDPQVAQNEPPAVQEEPVQPFSFGEGLDYAMEHETLMGYGAKLYATPDFEPDPDLNLTMGYFDENFSDIPRQYHDYLYEGESIPEIQYRAASLRLRLKDEARFQEMSVPAQLGTLLTSTVLDAPAMAATLLISTGAGLLTEGVGAVPGYAAVATRLGVTGKRIARIAGIGAGVATEAAIQEALLASNDPLKNEQTVMLAGLMGFGFGTIGGEVGYRLGASKIRKAAAADQKALTDQLIREAAQEVAGTKTPKRDFTVSTTAGSPVDVLYENVGSPEVGKLNYVGIDLTSQLKRSKDPEFQKLGNIMGEDGIYGGGPTMALEFDTTTRPVLADGLKGMNEAYNEWAKDQGIGIAGRIGHKNRQTFNERTALMVRGVIEPQTAAERKATSAAQRFFQNMLGVAKKSGVAGFEEIKDNIQYLTRSYSPESFRKAALKFGDMAPEVITRTLKGAIMEGQNEFDDEVAAAIAKGIYNRSMQTKLAPDDKFTTVLTNSFKDELEGILADAELDAKKIEEIMAKVTKKSDNGLSVTKHRIDMNEGYVDVESGLKFTDLLDNNTERIMVRYARQVGGASAAARFGYSKPQDLINHIQRSADKAFREGRLTENEAKRMRKKATNLANQILGRPNEDHGTFEGLAQVLMDYEYIRTSGGFALASLPEMMITTAENGLTATLKHTPIANKFISGIRKGVEPDKELLNVLESWGVGRDVDMMNAFVRIAEDDALNNTLSTGVKALNAGKRIAAMASGLPQLTRFSQMVAGKSTIQKFADMAHSGKPVKLRQWLKQLGFSNEQQLENVFAGLNKHSITQEGLLKSRTVVGLDYDGWMKEDPAAATQFMYAVARAVNHQIQRNLPGEIPEFMSKTWGKLLTQFQTFGIAAYGKKTLNAVARHDVESAVAIGLTTTMATMIYAARMYVLAQTRDDPEAFLEERLSPDNLVKAAIQRSGYVSVLPAMVDNGLAMFQQNRIFNDYARTSGLNVGGVESVPAAQTGLNAAKAVGGLVINPIKGDQIEEKDVRAATDMLPLRRLPGINFTLETLINQFPERGKEK